MALFEKIINYLNENRVWYELPDRSILDNEIIAFNAGDHAKSVKMKLSDYVNISGATLGDFSKI